VDMCFFSWPIRAWVGRALRLHARLLQLILTASHSALLRRALGCISRKLWYSIRVWWRLRGRGVASGVRTGWRILLAGHGSLNFRDLIRISLGGLWTRLKVGINVKGRHAGFRAKEACPPFASHNYYVCMHVAQP